MKLSETIFRCDWCQNIQEHIMLKNQTIKPQKSHGQIRCNNCYRYISQKTQMEIEK